MAAPRSRACPDGGHQEGWDGVLDGLADPAGSAAQPDGASKLAKLLRRRVRCDGGKAEGRGRDAHREWTRAECRKRLCGMMMAPSRPQAVGMAARDRDGTASPAPRGRRAWRCSGALGGALGSGAPRGAAPPGRDAGSAWARAQCTPTGSAAHARRKIPHVSSLPPSPGMRTVGACHAHVACRGCTNPMPGLPWTVAGGLPSSKPASSVDFAVTHSTICPPAAPHLWPPQSRGCPPTGRAGPWRRSSLCGRGREGRGEGGSNLAVMVVMAEFLFSFWGWVGG